MKCCKKIRESTRASIQTGRKALAVLLAATVLLCTLPVVSVSAASVNDTFIDSGINYQVTSTTEGSKQVSVVCNAASSYSGAVTIPDSVTSNGATYSVTSIDQSAFEYCSGLTAVTIPSSVTAIGKQAFDYCSSLASVTFEPNSQLQSIGDSAFDLCTSLATINLDQTPQLTSIGQTAFLGDAQLAQVFIPSGVTSIGQRTFASCNKLSEVNIGPDSQMSTIGDYAFNSCKISGISIPSGVTSIGIYAFGSCCDMTSIDFGQGSQLTTIGHGAFMSNGIHNITIPANVSSIGDDVFLVDNNLTQITVDSQNQTYCDINGVLFNHDKTTLIAYPGGLEGAYTIPSGVTKVSDEAIRNCKLTALTVPSGVTTLGLACLRDNAELTDVTFLGDVPPDSISRDCFAGYTTPVKVHVPAGTTNAYTTAFKTYVDANQITIIAALPAAQVGDTFIDNGIKYEVTSTNPKKVKVIANNYSGNITVPAKVTYATDGQDYDVTEIGDAAFRLCFNLHSVSLPSSLTVIGDDAFMASPITGTMTIPDGVTSIGKSAFTGCSLLTSIVLPSSLASIGDSVFGSCINLSITLDPNNSDFCMQDGVLFNKEKTSLVSFPAGKAGSEYTVPSGVTSIAGGAFYGTRLTKITIPSGITSIGDFAFAICSSLTDLTFQGSAPQTVGNRLFNNDSYPLTVHIPANETENYETAFTAYLPDTLTFVAATLPSISTPSGLSWDGTTAKWGAVTGASGYKVTLCKDNEAIATKDVGADIVSYDFKDEISGNGNYTFTVIAKGNGSTSSDSTSSEASTKYTGGASAGTVSAFNPLSSSVKTQSVASGTAESALNLPDSLDATVNGSETSISGVTWSSSPAYDGSTARTYTFTAVLPDGYNLSGSAALPTITVTVGAQTDKTITAFEDLSNAVKNKAAAIGATVASLNLPKKLKVVADGVSGLEVSVSRWICTALNSSLFSKAGAYIFTPVLDSASGYTLASDVTLPSVTVTVQGSSSNHHHSSDTSSSSSPSTTSSQTTGTQVDTASNTATVTTVPDGVTNADGTAQISVTVPNVTGGTGGSLDTGKAGKVKINLPESTMVQQLNAKQKVDLTLSVPSSVAQQTNSNTSVDIPVGSDVFAAAKANGTDVVINIKDADTQKLAYTWTFKGADLAKSATPVTDVNIGMAIRLTTEVPKVNQLTPNNTGLVLMFDYSGVLPSTASLTFSAKEKGFKPGQKLYFYFYNAAAGQLEPQGQEYTVDADGNVTVQVSHCSNYVLLPNEARTITLDTRTYTIPVGSSYVTGVKLTGVSGAKLKAYSSTKGIADVTVLSNGNVKAVALKPGLTYVMIDVYDSKNNFLTHASVRLIVENNGMPKGNSTRQFGIF